MILGPTARPFVVLGGEFARSVRRRGELVMAFQYVNTEPAMVIWSGTRQAGAFAICLSVAHEYLDDSYLVFQAMAACGRRRQIDPVCRFPVTQRDDLEPIAGRGIAAINGGSVKSRRQHAA